MGSVINLNRFRKAKKRAEADRRAAENRVVFGRTKAVRRQAQDVRERTDRDLENKRLD
jgi:hypothetical protein